MGWSSPSPANASTVSTAAVTLQATIDTWATGSARGFWSTSSSEVTAKTWAQLWENQYQCTRTGSGPWTYSLAINISAQGQTVYWKMIEGDTTVSSVYSYTQQIPAAASTLTSPANAATLQALALTASWAASTYATKYYFYLGTDSPPTNVYNGTDNGTSLTKAITGLVAGTAYNWRVRAYNAYGDAYSSTFSFTTTALPTKATTPSPADEAIDVARSATTTWVDGGAGGTGPATSYDVYFGTDPTPDASESQGNQAPLAYDPGTLKAATTYYWRIDAVNAAGTTTGDIWSFTTGSIATGTPVDRNYKRRLVAAADNQFWYENDSVPSNMQALAGLTLDTTVQTSMFEAYQKIFIANGSNLKVVDFTNTILGYSTALTAPPAHGDVLTQATSLASMVVDYVSADLKKIYGFVVTSAEFDTTNNVEGSPSTTLDPDPFIPTSITKPTATKLKFNSITTTPVAGDTLTQNGGDDTYTTLLIHSDGTDASTPTPAASGQTITYAGNAQVDTAQKVFGTASLLLDGTGDNISVPYEIGFDFGTGDFTIDCRIRFAALPATGKGFVISQYYLDATHYWIFMIFESAGAYLPHLFGMNGATNINSSASFGLMLVDTWYHVALTKTSSQIDFYLDGTKYASTSDSTDLSFGAGSTLYVGKELSATYLAFNGWVDEFRISKGIARWTKAFTLPDAAYAVAGATMVVQVGSTTNNYILGVATGTFNTDYAIASDDAGATMAPASITPTSIVEGASLPHYYDWVPFPDLDGGSANQFGSMPDKGNLGCLYRGRTVISGNEDYPHQWYMARQANPWDWQYFANDAQSAVAGNDSDVGEIGDIVKALIPYSDDYMVIGGDLTIWVLRGDPAAGGSLDQIGFTTGIWGKDSWTWDSTNNLYFLGSDGIYLMPSGLGNPINLTRTTIPNFIDDWGLDAELHRVTMSYDQNHHGLLICKTTLETGANQNYWFDLRVGDTSSPGGFFPETYPDECGVYANHFYKADGAADRRNLIGCADGYIRTFDDAVKDDDTGASTTDAIASDVLLGPIAITPNSGLAAVTNQQIFVTAGGGVGGTQEDTDSITYQIFIANTAEEIIEQVTAVTPDPKFSGTISGPGKSTRKRHRGRGVFMGIRILNITASETWAIDRVLVDVQQRGRVK